MKTHRYLRSCTDTRFSQLHKRVLAFRLSPLDILQIKKERKHLTNDEILAYIRYMDENFRFRFTTNSFVPIYNNKYYTIDTSEKRQRYNPLITINDLPDQSSSFFLPIEIAIMSVEIAIHYNFINISDDTTKNNHNSNDVLFDCKMVNQYTDILGFGEFCRMVNSGMIEMVIPTHKDLIQAAKIKRIFRHQLKTYNSIYRTKLRLNRCKNPVSELHSGSSFEPDLYSKIKSPLIEQTIVKFPNLFNNFQINKIQLFRNNLYRNSFDTHEGMVRHIQNLENRAQLWLRIDTRMY